MNGSHRQAKIFIQEPFPVYESALHITHSYCAEFSDFRARYCVWSNAFPQALVNSAVSQQRAIQSPAKLVKPSSATRQTMPEADDGNQ